MNTDQVLAIYWAEVFSEPGTESEPVRDPPAVAVQENITSCFHSVIRSVNVLQSDRQVVCVTCLTSSTLSQTGL